MMRLLKDNVLIVCIYGAEGSDKSALADMLMQRHYNLHREKAIMGRVTEFTDRREKRVGEGDEYVFLDCMPKYEDGEVFTLYKDDEGNRYWTTETMARKFEVGIIVTDEDNVGALRERSDRYKKMIAECPTPPDGVHRWPWTFDVFAVKMERTDDDSSETVVGVTSGGKDDEWDALVECNGDKDALWTVTGSLHTKIMRGRR